jgi:C4-dicarboxylate-specific signal transduction histidine kinase
MVALIAETNRLYARLALHTAARERERDARLMAMDAVAAAIAQEIGQPVAAARLSAAAGLEWLDRSAPDPKMAIKSMRGSIDAGDRIFDVIKGIRATISNGSSSLSEFSLNELVRETVGSMHNDLAAGKITVRMDLDEALPPILANRIQLGRVLVNLISNAIEAVGERRKRSIEIRTSLDGDHLLLAVADNGEGIPAHKITQIFDPFVTTKRGRIGLGLSLSRTIVEENGGRLWAEASVKHGATLIIKLPMRVSSKRRSDTSSVGTFP